MSNVIPGTATIGQTGHTSDHNLITSALTSNLLQLQATTGASGFALQNATPTILTWTAPSDGNMHRAMLIALILVSSNETGGQVQIVFTGPGASATTQSQVFAAGLTASTSSQIPSSPLPFTVASGTTVSLVQNTALTAGVATVWAEIWGL